MVTSVQQPQIPVTIQNLSNVDKLAQPLLGAETAISTISQQISVKDVIDIGLSQIQGLPVLKSPEEISKSPLFAIDVKNMGKEERQEIYNSFSGFSGTINAVQQYRVATDAKIENITREILTKDKGELEKMFPIMANLDESEIKQLSQVVNLLLAGNAIAGEQHIQNALDDIKSGKQSVESAKESQFIGIISSDILVELRNLLSQIKSIINTTDRQLQADFLKLKTQMVQSAADTTIQEGKAAFQAALAGFAVSMAMTTVSALGQAKQLHTQTKAINTHGVAKNNFNTDAQKSIELSRSSMVKTGNKSIDQQNALAGARHQDASNRSRLEADKHQTQLDRVTNETQKKSAIIETFSRLSDNLGQVVSAGLNQEVKILEAHKIVLQDIGETARAIATDKEKQIDTVLDLMKKVFDILKEVIEGQIRTFQAVATRG